MMVNRVLSIVYSPREKTLNLHQESEKTPKYGIRHFLFNGVPSGTFLSPVILWISADPVTRCVHDLIFEIGNLKKWRIPVCCQVSEGPVVMHD
jgi:hypothetical protein